MILVGWISGEYNKCDIGTKTRITTKRQYELLISIFDDKVYTITKYTVEMMVKRTSPHLWK